MAETNEKGEQIVEYSTCEKESFCFGKVHILAMR